MIQRIQSVYLLLVAVISGVMLFLPLTYSQEILTPFNDLFICFISMVIIFLFKNRKLQIKMCWVLITFQFILLALHIYNFIANKGNDTETIGGETKQFILFLGLISLSILLSFFAQRAVKKDDELVRSADRLR